MSFYRTMLAAVAAIALASPVFADDTASMPSSDSNNNPAAAEQVADASAQAAPADQQSTESRININKASAKELMKVKGINASKARAIVAYRKKNGSFNSIEDLTKVKGFKKVNSDQMREIQGQLSAE